MRNVRNLTAVFLLEAAVLLGAGVQWGSAFTQRQYGTGSADVWEVGASHNRVSDRAYREGWLTLQPQNKVEYENPVFKNFILEVLDERAPRLIVLETPAKIWNLTSQSQSGRANAQRQREKMFCARST